MIVTWGRLAVVLAAFSLRGYALAPAGIPRALAIERAAELSNLRYKLTFTLAPHAASAPGHEEIRFSLSAIHPLLLDFRGDAAANLILNERPLPVKAENGHIEIPAEGLTSGENLLTLDFSAPIAEAGKAITRYEDKEDGGEYLYTLFVPMDASMAFPCFDQPDLKGRFTVTVNSPSEWTVISNAKRAGGAIGSGLGSQVFFEETKPISTYLLAFAAGPFKRIQSVPGAPDVYIRRSQIARAESEVPQVQQTTRDGMRFLSGYFAQPFPFPKYDLVLIPGFPYGGMEHAGATFLNEDSVLFRSAPTEDDRFNRAILLLHELAHQWFGDFTTMRWFDDLWLKEGFAQYMAFRTMANLSPASNVWAHFYQQIKPAAYAIDVTQGTTPIYQDIENLKDAKSAYGAIVYSKAPGLLRQLAFQLGDERFRNGLRLYLAAHPYANAQWSDLVDAFEKSSGERLTAWADAWIRRRGAPRIDTHWACADSKIVSFSLTQQNVLPEGGYWPIATQLLLDHGTRPPDRLRVDFSTASTAVPKALGKACPNFVFANDGDNAYGLFVLDPQSRAYIQKHVGETRDIFQRTLLWGALWDSLRFAEMSPREYLSAALRDIPAETEELITRSVNARSVAALHEYVPPGVRLDLTPQFEKLAASRMLDASERGQRIVWFRTLVSASGTSIGLSVLKDLLSAKVTIPEVELRPLDRWRIIAALIAQGDPDAGRLWTAEKQMDQSGIGPKYAYIAAAATPTAESKKRYFDDYLHNPARQEDWVQESLANFNQWNQSNLTQPYLEGALAALPEIKRERKIFFVVAWLEAFIGGQQSRAADEQVHRWLETAPLDPDLRLKVLQAVDDLDRTVKIRERYP